MRNSLIGVLKAVLTGAVLVVALAGALQLAGSTGEAAGTRRGPVPPPQPDAFYWVTHTLALAGETAATPQPPLPDLSVQWIGRSPRYSRYCVTYDRGVPELCPGAEDDKRFPDPGEIVTFTARVANQGMVASPAVSATWQMDENAAILAAVPALEPGVTATLAITWPWQTDPHTLTVALDTAGTLGETTRSNNVLQHQTDSLYLDIAVHPLVEAAFAQRPNMASSWSFDDWIQAQVSALNENLAASSYPAAPDGALDRVRIERIVVTEVLGDDEITSTLEFDGRWTFRVERDDPDTPEDEAAESAERYAAQYADAIDWGLVHELAHQLGVIDLYQLNVAESYQNEVVEDDRPLLMGFQWTNPGLMGGGDRGEHPWYRFSQHTVQALNQNHNLRRGYFGEYLFDLPGQASVLVLDNRSQPLANARVDAYQTELGTVLAQPVFTGYTDEAGRLALPDRPVPFGGLVTATGHELRPNPFGNIDVVGWNGQLLLAVSRGDQHAYAWWPLTDLNLAAWRGESAVTRTVMTHLPEPDAPLPPAALDGTIRGTTVTLSWSGSPDPDVVGYRVYRGDEPEFYPFRPVATISETTFVDTRLHTARYAVTALASDGRESGFSPILRAPRLVLPVAVAIDPDDGSRVVLDRHEGALVTQQADGRWIGRQGSVHLGLTGSEGLSRNAGGQLLIAGTSEDRITVLDEDLTRVNWFGREAFVAGPLAGPASVVQAGPGFTVQAPAIADADTLGLARFDDDIKLSSSQPLTASGVTMVAGRFGSAVRVNGHDQLVYDAGGHVDPDAGSLQLWVRPEWTWNDDREHALVEIGTPGQGAAADGYRLRLAKAYWNGLYASIDDGTRGLTLYGGIEEWQPGTWHHLAVAWQPVQPGPTYRRYTLWIDGMLQDSQVLRRPASGPFSRIAVGSGLDGADQADAAIDELHLSAAARVGNSQSTRLLVSQRNLDRVDVLDWLGNTISSLGNTGSSAGQFRSPQGLAIDGDTVWVADQDNARVQVLHFDGDALSKQGLLIDGLIRPHSIAATGQGSVLVSDPGDNSVKLLDGGGTLRRRWTGPTDGQAGNFACPAGLALTVEGDVLVADRDNGRLARIVRPLAAPPIYLPLMRLHGTP